MPWEFIKYVSSGITLIAFLGALAAWLIKFAILRKERMIKSATSKEKAKLVESALEFFKVDTRALTREQKYNLALQQIHQRARRFRTIAIVVVVVAGLAAAVSL